MFATFKEMTMKRLAVLLLVVWAVGLAGCNTMEGLGKDVKTLGDKIENKAEQKKSY
jgi:predicted small secreted protein